jgi:hypothetical protein
MSFQKLHIVSTDDHIYLYVYLCIDIYIFRKNVFALIKGYVPLRMRKGAKMNQLYTKG